MKLKLLFFFIFLSQFIFSQDFQTKKADIYFAKTYYTKAIPLYEEALKNDTPTQTLLNLADAYTYTYQVQKAASLYQKILARDPKLMDEKHLFMYLQTLKASGNEQKANETASALSENKTAHKENLNYLENVAALGERFQIKNLPLNTAASEFGGTFYRDQLVFAATKKETSLLEKIYYWNNHPYLDLYQIALDSVTKSTNTKVFSDEINSKLHESNAVFTTDGKTVYFTRNNYLNGKLKRDDQKVTQLQIYKAELIDGKWKNISSLPINSDEFSNEHPALSPDGKTLYFASNRPGGFGSFDIYQVNTNNFSDPENLGAVINTKHKEQFPFIDDKGNLYFSSDGHPGFGFLDVFIAKPSNNGFGKPDNVGFPVNSGYDDFAYVVNTSTQEGFFSSNRPSGKGSDDIYHFKETQPLMIEDCYQLIVGTVRDKHTNELLSNASVNLILDNEEIQKLITDEKGVFNFKILCNNNYKITASKKAYTSDSTFVKTNGKRKLQHERTLYLQSFEKLEEIKKEQEKQAIAQAEKDKKEAIARAEQEKKKAEEKAKREAAEKEIQKKKRIAKIAETEKDIIKKDNEYFIKTEPIYFDYDLWYMRKESRAKLQTIITLMKKYPKMQIEIGTHTDIRGNNKYNQELSQKRSNSVQEFLGENGIALSRIKATGYGEKFPIVYCETEEACNEEQHEINRRCEFKILNFE
ncbi:OmpA family protein [Mesonia sp. K7]|uniref:OmpA family protein n=1 Tax=Mesonia sp. K7 TaxID=2218606 RepID=UPI000DA9CA71|nr:OmpA family protein [Mesonia sp. K7]PZD78113.1 flagellar motor protein MotB [Mesonia sp. K7]